MWGGDSRPREERLEAIARLRVLVGYLGEKGQLGWWPTDFHTLQRGLELPRPGGGIGTITSRTCFFLSSFRKWREQVVLGIARPEVRADLGHCMMDDAMVEAAAYWLWKV